MRCTCFILPPVWISNPRRLLQTADTITISIIMHCRYWYIITVSLSVPPGCTQSFIWRISYISNPVPQKCNASWRFYLHLAFEVISLIWENVRAEEYPYYCLDEVMDIESFKATCSTQRNNMLHCVCVYVYIYIYIYIYTHNLRP